MAGAEVYINVYLKVIGGSEEVGDKWIWII